MACSWDGSVAYIQFDEKELGQIVSIEEKESMFQRMYGKKSFCTGPNSKTSTIIEDPDWIQPQSLPAAIEDDGGSDSRASRSSQIVKGPTDKQIETRTVDGRRRITPVFIPPPMEEEAGPHNAPSQMNSPPTATPVVAPTFSSSSELKSKIVVEKRDEVTKPGLPVATSPTPPPPLPPTSQPASRKEISSILLNRRLDRSEPERRVASVKVSKSTSDLATTGISIVGNSAKDKAAITPPTVQKTLSTQVHSLIHLL